MKLLVADIGNTNCKYGIYEKDELLFSQRIPSSAFVKRFSKVVIKYRPQYALIADVTGQSITMKVSQAINIIKWNRNLQLPFSNKYRSKTLGQDRMALATGGQFYFPHKNVLIISAGTCITYDFVNNKGEYLGGAISPGLQMRVKALHTLTAKLPLIKLENKYSLIGKTTQSSINSGVINGALQEVTGMINQYKNRYKGLKVILTGGDTGYFEPELKKQIFAARELTLTGLNQILQLNISEE